MQRGKIKKKLALVTSGGGTECAYSAGAILALAENYILKDPDIIIGGSGSTVALSYYISGQYESIRNIWINLLDTNKLIDVFRINKILDIDYLIDTIFKKQDVLNSKKVYASKSLYLIAATNSKTGKLEYFSNKDGTNIFENMRASMALPIAYNKTVRIKGKQFCDTPISSSIELNVKKAIDLGANKIIVINNEYIPPIMGSLFEAWLFLKNKHFKKNYNNESKLQKNFNLLQNVKLLYIAPKKKIKTEILDSNKKHIKSTFEQGYKEILENKELKKFLLK